MCNVRQMQSTSRSVFQQFKNLLKPVDVGFQTDLDDIVIEQSLWELYSKEVCLKCNRHSECPISRSYRSLVTNCKRLERLKEICVAGLSKSRRNIYRSAFSKNDRTTSTSTMARGSIMAWRSTTPPRIDSTSSPTVKCTTSPSSSWWSTTMDTKTSAITLSSTASLFCVHLIAHSTISSVVKVGLQLKREGHRLSYMPQ